MIEPKTDIERLQSSKEFKEWQSNNPDSYLSDFFCILDNESSEDNIWQIDYYNPKEDTMTSFELPADKRKSCKLKQASSKIYKKEKDVVEKLELTKVTQNDADTISIAKEKLKEEHPSEVPTKIILILQHNKELNRTIWNLTLMTSALNMFNAKIDASDGNILESSLKSAISLKKEILPGKDSED